MGFHVPISLGCPDPGARIYRGVFQSYFEIQLEKFLFVCIKPFVGEGFVVFHEIGRVGHIHFRNCLGVHELGKHFELFFGHLSAFGDDGGNLLNGYANGFPEWRRFDSQGSVERSGDELRKHDGAYHGHEPFPCFAPYGNQNDDACRHGVYAVVAQKAGQQCEQGEFYAGARRLNGGTFRKRYLEQLQNGEQHGHGERHVLPHGGGVAGDDGIEGEKCQCGEYCQKRHAHFPEPGARVGAYRRHER